jgi:hypothetical protein
MRLANVTLGALVASLVLAFTAPVFADDNAVALLPLDADQKLAIYSQSVASEVAHALVAAGVDVAIVGPKESVPARARLIVDGTITGKPDAVTLTLRIRDARVGAVLGSVPASAATVTKATEDLSAKVVPAIKQQLAQLHTTPMLSPPEHAHPVTQAAAGPIPVLAEVVGGGPLGAALTAALPGWVQRPIDPLVHVMVDMVVPAMPATHERNLAIALDVLDYSVEPGEVPLARARVRVRVVDRTHVVFDRVIVTDTVVGDRKQPEDALAVRTAREVLAILEPQLRRRIPAWR